jgi:hypothetical protein
VNRFVLATTLFTTVLAGGAPERASAQPEPASAPPAPAAAPDASAPDDLAKAADATADVANVPAATKASSDDIDLSSLGLDPATAAFDDKLNVYGFADISYAIEHWSAKIPTIPENTRTFGVGNLNVYLAKNLMAKARTLAEIRFTFLPNGSQNADGSYVSTTAQDLSNFTRPTQWGGIVIERVYVEYDLTDYLTIRIGHWLTPYGIWNIDHGSPAILGTMRPYIIGEQFFPEHQTGLDAFGSHYLEGFKANYHLTASNGRGATEAVVDQDNKLAFGARLEVETPWGLRIGGSYYRGRYTGLPATAGALAETFQEVAYGGDAQIKMGALHVQGEVIARERHYVAGERAATTSGFAADGRDVGLYALADYRFEHLWNVTPYTVYERYKPAGNPYFAGIEGVTLGLNFRPTPSLVLKVQANRTAFDPGGQLLSGQAIYYYATQASWVF